MIELLQNIEFKNPYMLLLSILPIAWFIYRLMQKKENDGFTVSSDKRMDDISILHKISWLPDLLRALALIAMIIGIARPQVTLESEVVKGEGVDIMLVMDLSGSMLAEDFKPNRIEVSKKVAKEFVDRRPFDRIGLTVFSKEAFTQCPLTTDHEILKDYLSSIEVGMLNDGTAIGMGLATSLNRLIESPSASKIVILLTDGDNNAGYIAPLTAAEIAKEYGIKVYTIGVGSDGGRIGGNGFFSMNMRAGQIDEKLLTQVANMTTGKYFRARDAGALENIYAEIDRLEKSEIELEAFKRYSDKYSVFLWLGLGMLLIEILLRKLIFKPL